MRESRAAARCIQDGPTQGHCLNTTVQEVGPCEDLRKGFQTAVGQLELISNIHAFNPWANSIMFSGSTPAAGPRESLVRQSFACWMGQCELIALIFWPRKWAHAKIMHEGFQTAVGELELINDIRAFTPQSNARPMREFHAAARFVLDGPMRVHCPNILAQEVGPCEDFA